MRKTAGVMRWLGLVGLLTLLLPVSASALEMRFKADTLLRGFERDTATKTDATVLPIYEYFQADVETPGEPGLGFHLYGWGRWDLADNDFYDDATAGELLYGYLEYSAAQARFNARLGRQYVFEGVANESIDGLRVSSDLGKYFSGSLYAGQPVALADENGRSGDSIYGGRLAYHLAGLGGLGLSYKKIESDGDNGEETAGLDLSAYLPYNVSLYGFSAFNVNAGEWREHSYELRFPLGPANLRPYFQKFRYKDYFGIDAGNVNPFLLLAKSGEELTVLGTDLTLPVGENWTLVGKVKNYDYSILNDNAQYFGAQATWASEGNNQIGGELGVMNGDTDQNKYTLVRLYTYWGQMPDGCPLGFVSTDLVYVYYDREIYGEDSSLFISLGIGRKFMEDALALKLSGDYSSDPYFDKDVRGMLTVSYRFDQAL